LNRYLHIVLIPLLLLCLFGCEDKDRKKTISQNRVATLLEKANSDKPNDSVRLRYLDSAYQELQESPNDTATRHYLLTLSADYYNHELYDRAISSSSYLYRLSSQSKDSSRMARALYISADAYYGKQNRDSAFYQYSQSEKIYDHINDLGRLGEVVLYKAYIYYDIGEYESCEAEAVKALKLLQNENKTEDVYYCYNLIATALDGQNNNTEALKYYQYTLDQLESLQKKGYTDSQIASNRSSCYNNMGYVYVKTGQYNTAQYYFNRALSYKDLESINPELYARLLNNLAYAKFKSDKKSDVLGLFYKSLSIRQKVNDKPGVISSQLNLGEYFAANKDTARAISYLKSAHNIAAQIKSHAEVLNALRLLSEIDHDNSSSYSTEYFKVNKELQDAAKKVRGRFARIAYETDRLQYEKEELIKKNSFIIGLSAVILLFVAAIFIIYYLNSRNKKLLLIQQQQRANEEIYQLMFEQQSKVESARQEEKNRIAMELHDGILNNIYAVRLNLEFINKKADEESVLKRKEYIKELQNVEQEIRGVSHDLSRNAIFQGDKSFKTLLEFMVNSQKNNFDTLFDLDIDPDVDWEAMSNIVKVNIYRIIQEALQNINKYSKAKHAHVDVKKDGNTISVKVTDDGIGFNPDKVKGGIGIRNLRKRAASLNGNLNVESAPGKGSTIEVLFTV
jgi:signal transduction histidine kinase